MKLPRFSKDSFLGYWFIFLAIGGPIVHGGIRHKKPAALDIGTWVFMLVMGGLHLYLAYRLEMRKTLGQEVKRALAERRIADPDDEYLSEKALSQIAEIAFKTKKPVMGTYDVRTGEVICLETVDEANNGRTTPS